MPVVRFDASFLDVTGGRTEVTDSSDSLLSLILSLGKQFPGFESVVLDHDVKQRNFVIIYVDGVDIRGTSGLATRLNENSVVHIKKLLAGG